MGSLYRQRGRDGQLGRIFWTSCYVNGRRHQESTGTDDEKKAKQILKQRESRVTLGLPVLPRADRIRYDEAAADLRAHYQTTGSRDLKDAAKLFKHLDPFFQGRRLASLDGALVTEYVLHRQGEGAANGTVNRELGLLSRMLRLAAEHNKVLRLPTIHKLKEPPPRAGFFEMPTLQPQHFALRAPAERVRQRDRELEILGQPRPHREVLRVLPRRRRRARQSLRPSHHHNPGLGPPPPGRVLFWL
jgi:hypothetical protein